MWRTVVPQLKVTIPIYHPPQLKSSPYHWDKESFRLAVILGGLKSDLLFKTESTVNSEQVVQGFAHSKSMLIVMNYFIFLCAPRNGFQADLFNDFLRELKFAVWCFFLLLSTVHLLFFSHKQPPCSNLYDHPLHPWRCPALSHRFWWVKMSKNQFFSTTVISPPPQTLTLGTKTQAHTAPAINISQLCTQ